MAIKFLFNCIEAIAVVPDPEKQSKTIFSSIEELKIRFLTIDKGLIAGCFHSFLSSTFDEPM